MEILYIGIAAALLCYVGLMVLKIVVNKKRQAKELGIQKEKEELNLDIVDDVRYTVEENPVTVDEVTQEETVNATYKQADIILPQSTPMTVSTEGELKPGKYIILSTDENISSFNIRVGIYVREYKHNQEIVLAEGDTICAVSCNVILR
ncbi:MAG: hypothetical protein IKB42_02240 [Clostridia bacterium]|nr:hypothetical protein [Clostridia bacterium]